MEETLSTDEDVEGLSKFVSGRIKGKIKDLYDTMEFLYQEADGKTGFDHWWKPSNSKASF